MPKSKYYYWIVTRDQETGKPYLLTGGDTEIEARRRGLEMLGGTDFEIKRYPTRDRNEASAYYRGKRLEHGDGLKKSSQRIAHEKTLKRRRPRQERPSWM